MDPVDFHKTADLLSAEQEEAHIRTSINRSYYGLFLYLREFFTANGVRLPDRKTKSHHQFILECIHNALFLQDSSETIRKPGGGGRPRDQAISDIYKRLQSLLQRRTDADYKLNVTFRASDSQDSLRLATTTIDDFKKLGSARENHVLDTAKVQSKKY